MCWGAFYCIFSLYFYRIGSKDNPKDYIEWWFRPKDWIMVVVMMIMTIDWIVLHFIVSYNINYKKKLFFFFWQLKTVNCRSQILLLFESLYLNKHFRSYLEIILMYPTQDNFDSWPKQKTLFLWVHILWFNYANIINIIRFQKSWKKECT